MKYLRRYRDRNEWEEISRKEAVEKLGRYYDQAESIVRELENGVIPLISTPWAMFRAEEEGEYESAN